MSLRSLIRLARLLNYCIASGQSSRFRTSGDDLVWFGWRSRWTCRQKYQGGREQTFFKHEVLRHYLRAWSQKLGSVSQTGRRVRLWYVDCFAGPWSSRTEDRADTSVAIGLNALEEALSTWVDAPAKVEAGAIFVEANPISAAQLTDFLRGRDHKGVAWQVLVGEFGSQVGAIQGVIGEDAAFLFVDPTGWKGAGMQFIAPLAAGRWRDVMVNVMFHHINRWKDDHRQFLRNQMRDLFGLGVGTRGGAADGALSPPAQGPG